MQLKTVMEDSFNKQFRDLFLQNMLPCLVFLLHQTSYFLHLILIPLASALSYNTIMASIVIIIILIKIKIWASRSRGLKLIALLRAPILSIFLTLSHHILAFYTLHLSPMHWISYSPSLFHSLVLSSWYRNNFNPPGKIRQLWDLWDFLSMICLTDTAASSVAPHESSSWCKLSNGKQRPPLIPTGCPQNIFY